jgi:hypothetical protein
LTKFIVLTALAMFFLAPMHANAAEPLQVENQSDLKIESITPVAEFFGTRNVTEKGKRIGQAEVFKTGYRIRVVNKRRSEATVKMELFLDYLSQGRTFSYIAYDIIGPGKAKDVLVMCDNIPVECNRKVSSKGSKSECKQLALETWDRHGKYLKVTRLK